MPSQSHFPLSPTVLRQWLNDGSEIALLDVREAGQFGEGHPFFAIPAPYSRLELDVPNLVPRRTTRIVLVDDGDGISARAADRLRSLGYSNLHVLAGGAPSWHEAGYTLFKGVNLPSKTFGELVEHAFHTPRLSAHDLHQRMQNKEPFVLLDGRTFAEHKKMTIPGALSVPNGELALCWHAVAPDPQTPIVIHCAGRTRSIIGTQILRCLGVPNPVLALENGTQGWALAGLPLEHGSQRRHDEPAPVREQDRSAAERFAHDSGVRQLSPSQAQAWIDDPDRTTYALDIRSAEEFSTDGVPGVRHAPGGQLLQATDQSIGVRHSRVIVLDSEAVRAPVVAAWLQRLGYEAATVEGGIRAPLRLPLPPAPTLPAPKHIPADALKDWLNAHNPTLLDIRPSPAYRRQHAAGARWSIRPRIREVLTQTPEDHPVLLVAPDVNIAALAASELTHMAQVYWTGCTDWDNAGLTVQSTADQPSDRESIDYLFFVHDRHDGNLDAARRYLTWETGLIAQCAPDELAGFRLSQPAQTGPSGETQKTA